jgi:hypothetical protein
MELAALCLDLGYKLAENVADLTRDQILFLTGALSQRAESTEEAKLASQGVNRIVVTEDENETE